MIHKKRATIPPIKPRGKELRIKIKKVTAENIMTMNGIVNQKRAELSEAIANLQNHILPLMTERGIPHQAILKEVTEKEPYEMVVIVPK